MAFFGCKANKVAWVIAVTWVITAPERYAAACVLLGASDVDSRPSSLLFLKIVHHFFPHVMSPALSGFMENCPASMPLHNVEVKARADEGSSAINIPP